MEFHGIPWNLEGANFDDTSNSMEFYGTRSAPISMTRAGPWNSMHQTRGNARRHRVWWYMFFFTNFLDNCFWNVGISFLFFQNFQYRHSIIRLTFNRDRKSRVRNMMTSSNGNIFRVTGHLGGEFTGDRWIPRTKASYAELWCILWSAPK